MIMDILLTLWAGCAMFNLLATVPILLDKEYEEKIEEAKRRENIEDEPSISKVGLVLLSIIAAPMISYLIITSGGEGK